MILTLDEATEKRIQREIDRGHYTEPSEVIAHALDLLAAQQDWLLLHKHALNERLEESYAPAQRYLLHTRAPIEHNERRGTRFLLLSLIAWEHSTSIQVDPRL